MNIEGHSKKYRTSETTVFSCQYHVIWCPKYRRKVLTEGIDVRLKELMFKYQNEIGYEVLDLEVMPDHVHALLDISADESPRLIVSRIKGRLSHELRTEFRSLRSRLPTLWTRSCFISSVGAVSLDVVKKYIDNQKNK